METWKSLNVKLSVKSWCFDRIYYVTVADADIETQKYHFSILDFQW